MRGLSKTYPGNRKVLAYVRELGDEAILCVANLGRSAQAAEHVADREIRAADPALALPPAAGTTVMVVEDDPRVSRSTD